MTNKHLEEVLEALVCELDKYQKHLVIVTFDNHDNPVYNEVSGIYVDPEISKDFPRRMVLKLTTENTL